MTSLFNAGMSGLVPVIGNFVANTAGYPFIATVAREGGWARSAFRPQEDAVLRETIASVFRQADDFRAFAEIAEGGDAPIPGTYWKLKFEGEDRLVLSRPRFSIALDRSPRPWTNVLEIRKDHVPLRGPRRTIAQVIRRTRDAAEPLREIKELRFGVREVEREFGPGARGLNQLEHQLMMQYNTQGFQPLGNAPGMALQPREYPPRSRFERERDLRALLGPDEATPAEGLAAVDPDFPHRVFYDFNAPRDSFYMYLSVRQPGLQALAMETCLVGLWNTIETFVETDARTIDPIRK